jgi:hypothetical protein
MVITSRQARPDGEGCVKKRREEAALPLRMFSCPERFCVVDSDVINDLKSIIAI